MRKMIAAALIAATALLLCACGRLPFQRAEPTTAAAGLTERQDLPATKAPASRKAAASAAVTGESATDGSAAAATTAPSAQTTIEPQATTKPVTTTRAETTTQAIATTAQAITTTVPATLPRVFDGAAIVLGGAGRGIDEDLYKIPHTVYAIDMNGRRFHFQPRAYTGGSFMVDVYLDNRDGSYTRLDTFTCATPDAGGRYSIVLVTPASKVTRDERQNLKLVENVYRFELSPAGGRYSVRLLATHAPYPLTAYYALDMNRAGGFVRFTT